MKDVYSEALAITAAVLFVKQHSVNCISAAMYAMSRFDPPLFPPEEARRFASDIFGEHGTDVKEVDKITGYIISLYDSFIEKSKESKNTERSWEEPLLDFLKKQPRRREAAFMSLQNTFEGGFDAGK